MTKKLVLLGAGGHAKVCFDIANKMNQWDQIVVLDDNNDNDFFEISGPIDNYIKYPEADFFVSIGNNDFRQQIMLKLLEENYQLATLVDPSAVVSISVTVDNGTVVMPGVVVNANSRIGKGVILNTTCSIDHDCIIGDYVHISPGANLAGNVTIGNNSWIGIGSTIIQGVEITNDCIIGAGSTVIGKISTKGIYHGSPAKKR